MVAVVAMLVTLLSAFAFAGWNRRVELPAAGDVLEAEDLEVLSAPLQALVLQSRVVRAALEGAVSTIGDNDPDFDRRRYVLGRDEMDTRAYRSHLVSADANILLGDLAGDAKALPRRDQDVLQLVGFPADRFATLIERPPTRIEIRGPWRDAGASPNAMVHALRELAAFEPALKEHRPRDPYRA